LRQQQRSDTSAPLATASVALAASSSTRRDTRLSVDPKHKKSFFSKNLFGFGARLKS
jgi:hypothetical protein